MKKLNTTSCYLSFFFILSFVLSTTIAFAQTLTVTLAPSNHNGFNISCEGAQDGILTANATGGTAPYTYKWSNGADTQTISNLAEGYYNVEVQDNNGGLVTVEITLTEPRRISVEYATHTYSNGYNVSTHFAADASVSMQITNGVTPYSFFWTDGGATQNRTGIHAGSYNVLITDANGCSTTHEFYLTAPDRDDWTTFGNIASNPATQFIGTSDAHDFLLRTNNLERLRIKSDGQLQFVKGTLKIDTISTDSAKVAYVDQYGILRSGGDNVQRCTYLSNRWYSTSCNGANPNNIYNYPSSGKVSIGTTQFYAGYKLAVEGKIICDELKVKARANWPDYVFENSYQLKPLEEADAFIKKHKHLPGLPSADQINCDEGIQVGDMQAKMLEKIEELYLYVINLQHQNTQLQKDVNDLKAQH